MKDKNLGIPINQDEVYHYLKDIRKIKVMTPDRERELAVKMKSNEISEKERKKTHTLKYHLSFHLNWGRGNSFAAG